MVDSEYGLDLERMLTEHLENEDGEGESELEMYYRSSNHTYPPIDGCPSPEVGWMKMQYSRVAPETYNLLSFDDYAWYHTYVRPTGMLPS